MDIIELVLIVDEEGADDRRIDGLTNSLAKQLRRLDLDYISRPAEHHHALQGTKGDPLTVGAIVLGLGTASLPVLLEFLRNWIGDRRKLTVETPNGAKLEFFPDKRLTTDEIIEFTKKLNQI